MHQQPNDRSCATEAIGGDHWGPVLVYMAQVDNALTAVGYEQNWFKVAEIGLPSNNPEYWATEVLNVRDIIGDDMNVISDIFSCLGQLWSLHIHCPVGHCSWKLPHPLRSHR